MDNCCKKSLKLLKCIFLPLLLPATGPVLPTYLKDGHPTQKFWLAPNWQIGGQQTKKGDYSQIWQGTSKSRPKNSFFFKNLSFSNNKTRFSSHSKKGSWHMPGSLQILVNSFLFCFCHFGCVIFFILNFRFACLAFLSGKSKQATT